MKQLITNYSFNKTSKTVTFTGFTSINLERVLIITNVNTNQIIYNFAGSGGTVSGNVLTLDYDTSSMSNNDELQIWYWLESTSPVYDGEATEVTAQATAWQMERLLNLLRPLGIVTGAGSNRLSIDVNSGTITAVTTVATVTAVTTVGSVTNQVNLGNVNAFTLQQATLRNAYANGISPNLTFS